MTSTGPFQPKITLILQHLPNACSIEQLMVGRMDDAAPDLI